VPVWPSQGALQRFGQEHQPVAGDVCPVQPVDGAQANFARTAGVSAPEIWASARNKAEIDLMSGKSTGNSALVSPCEYSCINLRCGGGCADLP